MVSNRRYLALVAIWCFCQPQIARCESIVGLFSTGVDDVGKVLLDGQVDLHYEIDGGFLPSYAIAKAPAWAEPPANASWIGPSSSTENDPVRNYSYTTSFILNGFDPDTATITGNWATDNDAHIYLNGLYTGNSKDIFGYETLAPFSITKGFVPGLNVLEIRVNNYPSARDNPTALLLSDVEGHAAPVPEPHSWSLLLASITALTWRRGCASNA